MSLNKLSKRYAKSLLDLSIQEGALEQVYQDIKVFNEHCEDCNDLYLLLKSPIVKSDRKWKIIRSLYEKHFTKISMNFLSIIVRKKREFYLKEISSEFIKQYKAYKNIVSAKLTTAVKVGDKVKSKVEAYVNAQVGKDVQLDLEVDESLIGGFVLEFDNNLYDSSISHQLKKLRKEFSKNLYIKKI